MNSPATLRPARHFRKAPSVEGHHVIAS
jgi:hypothetical protein